VAPAVRAAGVAPPARAAPRLGADTDALLSELGYAAEEIAALRAGAVIG
jgi:crotonobetainyl-CoA:carnitine CoA-transferase CaiB-like acyl-CoA transferase